MELHTFVGSPNGRKVEAVIAHLRMDVEIVHLDFPTGLRTPEYLALNPNAMSPTFVDGDFTLSESSAIMQYLADKAGDGSLFPREPRERADVVRWQFWETAHFNRAFGALAFETVAKPNLGIGPTDGDLVRRAQESLERFAPVLEAHFSGRRFAVSDAVTLADYSLATFEAYRPAVPFDWSRYPDVNAYFDRVHALEPWTSTAPISRSTKKKMEQAA